MITWINKNAFKSQLWAIKRNAFLIILCIVMVIFPVYSGVFEFAGNGNGPDVITHPGNYTGLGGNLIVTVGISPSSPHADEMVIPVQNAVNTWNHLIPTTGNVVTDHNKIQPSQFDFESVVLHELGHCIGLAHPNLASESGLTGKNRNFTKTTKGANNQFDLGSGIDGIIGSADDERGDDINLHWYYKANNNPFAIGEVIDKTTYSQNLADLPAGDLFVANGDREVAMLLGMQNTEAVMQQGIFAGETRRTLSADDVATLRLGMSGLDMIAGTADDYTLTLRFDGFTDAADIVINFDDMASFAACNVLGAFLDHSLTHISITRGEISFNSRFSWFFNDEITPPAGNEFPEISISANNNLDSLVLMQGDALSLAVWLNPGVHAGRLADYWVWADTPLGTFWLDSRLFFIRSDLPIRVFGGPLMNLSSFNILNGPTTELPAGTYTVNFAVDSNLDNMLDATLQDSITVTITPQLD